MVRHLGIDTHVVRRRRDHDRLLAVCGGLVVVAATADSVSHPSHDHQHQADDEKDDPNGPQQGHLQQETGDEKDDSEDDHDVYLCFDTGGLGWRVSV